MKIEITNEKAFSEKLLDFSDKVGVAPKRVAERVALDGFTNVVQRTPVDTGWARGSWNVSEGEPDSTTPDEPDEGVVLPEPPTPRLTTFEPYPVWYVTNNLPYIAELEAGRSVQSDKGYMVQRTLVVLEADIDAFLRRFRL